MNSGMKSLNFEFLRPTSVELAEIACFAEQYSYSDPASCLVKLRSFIEQIVFDVYEYYDLQKPYRANLNDLLNESSFLSITPNVVVMKLDTIRKQGNKAAHGDVQNISSSTATWLIKETFDIAQYYYLMVIQGRKSDIPEFQAIPRLDKKSEQLDREQKLLQKKLKEQDEILTKALKDLDNARAKITQNEEDLKTATELESILEESDSAVNSLGFTEAETRQHIIDNELVAAGWDINDPDDVGHEIEVLHQPTESGLGYADYVLWDDDGKPLAVIEAKRTSAAAQKGQNQAAYYADGLEKMTGHRPIIFFTNGYEIYIWDDAKGEAPRKIYGFYSKDSLQYLFQQTTTRKHLTDLLPNQAIAGRLYQIEAIKRVFERFQDNYRAALIVQATGSGKTRVAIAICEMLIRAGRAKRILFLCDRRELRKQAHDNFTEHLPDESRVYLKKDSYKDLDKRIYFGTYPGMMKCFTNFDVGFFDLIISDESHRSIYNTYREIFLYFDAMKLGLTATPVNFIQRNTYKLFGCEESDPTFSFSYEEAINSYTPCLVPYKVMKHTTKFLRLGIKYTNMTAEEKRQLDEQVIDSERVDYSKEQVNAKVFNRDTDKKIIRNLMENGIRNSAGTSVGKTIIFARKHTHAVELFKIFQEDYNQYGAHFCKIIDNYDPRAPQLIDDFKDPNNELTIAISVDMMDTGIDVPEVVNLVFAKPVKSFVKFWQMIGRGTRLCPDLFGPGKSKTHFQIYDHWGNFEYFDSEYEENEPAHPKALLQRLFESRLELTALALREQQPSTFHMALDLIEKDLADLPEKTIAVREKWAEKNQLQKEGVLQQFSATTKALLSSDMAPLMQWRKPQLKETAYHFDLLVADLQHALLKKSSTQQDLQQKMIERVSRLKVNLSQVEEKIDSINAVKSGDFWQAVTVEKLEKVRIDLRPIMHLSAAAPRINDPDRYINVRDSEEEYEVHHVKLTGLNEAAYRNRVKALLEELFENSPVLQKIKKGEAVIPEDLTTLAQKVESKDPSLRLNHLLVQFPNEAGRLDLAIRSVIGVDREKVDQLFIDFIYKYPKLTSHQTRFLDMLKQYIAEHGTIHTSKLWEKPFTVLNNEGVEGIFSTQEQVNDLLRLIQNSEFEATDVG